MALRIDRVEHRMDEGFTAVAQKLDSIGLRSELVELREKVSAIEHRIAEIEGSLSRN